MKVLLVDDIPENHAVLAASIKDLCDEGVLIAERATSGIEMAILHQPDLIFMDIGLPDLDGLDALSIIKKNPATAHIPVVVVSAHAWSDVVEIAYQRGCDSYITKPFSLSSVRDAVKKWKPNSPLSIHPTQLPRLSREKLTNPFI